MENGGDRLGYMVLPIDISERQALIYMQMYKKCNFQDMTVKYTLEQLSNDIRIIDIPAKTIYKNIKNMIDKGYIQIVKKASKGNPPLYRIVKMNEILGEPKVNQERTKGEPKHSKINALSIKSENQRRTKGEPKGHPIKEKEKDINIYSANTNEFEEIWKQYPNKKGKAYFLKTIPKIIKQYSTDEILRTIERYKKDVEEQRRNGFKGLNYKNGSTFFNTGYIDYLDSNYQKIETKQNSTKDMEEDYF